MDGIDRTDQNVSLYRTSIRGKKWYFPLIAYLLYVAEQNAWNSYKRADGNLDHLAFRLRVASEMLKSNKRNVQSRGRPSKTTKIESRYDGREHYVADLPLDENTKKKKQLHCRMCHKKSTTMCIRCDVPLHVACFLGFHTK